jgi:hypothetical protein
MTGLNLIQDGHLLTDSWILDNLPMIPSCYTDIPIVGDGTQWRY